MDYRDAGVDVEAGRAFVDQIRNLVHSTFRPEVIGGLGGFGGCFQLPGGFREPVLVSGTDGVGTKLKIAQILNRHDTVGIDLVAMCVNDVLTSGAEPLFFLDYLATGKLEKEQLTEVVAGIASGCKQAGCALLGGETAEMPGFYQVGEYDLAGFSVGIVEKSQMLDGSQVQIGDVAIALASAGIHSNGLSLVRKIVSERGFAWSERPELLGGETIGKTFLQPTRIYVKPVLAARQAGLEIHAMAHITGGGLPENLPRCLGTDQAIQVDPNSWAIPPVFQWLAEAGGVSAQAMYNTFNMGIGFVLLVPPTHVEQAITYFQSQDIPAFAIGEVITGSNSLVGLLT
ncbi:phosphoribosylformylglycinamidine cyclo-ligase [Nostoc sp. T09]|uniref:phosphoribosylformylglycinamidine cyclo-ligase n=1 Tax=Nostoc sp. T09 TaxID=1932621 RepID=UPI000A3850C1|nr:phosphoribosylformylglycinamidine cyclo-ligase [Nostoc sp. T09]OUL35456.1 phosphoribosylformylglycinamidine cyclo-ligase [Nostoc sp. T09]